MKSLTLHLLVVFLTMTLLTNITGCGSKGFEEFKINRDISNKVIVQDKDRFFYAKDESGQEKIVIKECAKDCVIEELTQNSRGVSAIRLVAFGRHYLDFQRSPVRHYILFVSGFKIKPIYTGKNSPHNIKWLNDKTIQVELWENDKTYKLRKYRSPF